MCTRNRGSILIVQSHIECFWSVRWLGMSLYVSHDQCDARRPTATFPAAGGLSYCQTTCFPKCILILIVEFVLWRCWMGSYMVIRALCVMVLSSVLMCVCLSVSSMVKKCTDSTLCARRVSICIQSKNRKKQKQSHVCCPSLVWGPISAEPMWISA